MKMKNVVKRGLVGAMALTMLLSNTVLTQARGWYGEVIIEVIDNIYDINLEYEVYDKDETPSRTPMDITDLNVPTTGQQEKSGTVYTMTPPEIEDKIYSGFEVKDKDDNIVTSYKPGQQNPENPSIQTDPNAGDVNYTGTDYTVVLVYEDDENDNETPDQDEFYIMNEYYRDKATGNELKARTAEIYDGNINYSFNSATDLDNLFAGYEYLGYSFASTFGYAAGHTGGQPDLLTGVPAFTLMSDSDRGIYDVNMFWQIDEDQWATLSYDPGAGSGTMASQKELKGTEVEIKNNEGFTNGNLKFVGWSIEDDNHVDDEDENCQSGDPYTLNQDTVLYAVWEKVTITFVKNSVEAVGTMESQEVDKGSTVNLNANQFVNAAHVFLGWSTSPDGGSDGLPEYQDGTSITPDEDITLYAIWGAPDMHLDLDVDKTMLSAGEETGFTMSVTNRNTPRSTTLYNAVIEISFNTYMNYVDKSVKVYRNGLPVNITESFNPLTQKLVIPLGTMEPRENCTINFIGKAKVATSQTLIYASLDGDVTPAAKATTAGSNNKIHMSTTSQPIRIR